MIVESALEQCGLVDIENICDHWRDFKNGDLDDKAQVKEMLRGVYQFVNLPYAAMSDMSLLIEIARSEISRRV